MRKMKTLFKREFIKKGKKTRIIIHDEVQEGCEWVLNGEGKATRKWDGTCCMIKDGELYKRFDFKPGRKLPDGAIPCQEKADEITGHFPHWVKCDRQNTSDKWFFEAFNNNKIEDGTFELVGEKINGNKDNIEGHLLIRHGIDNIQVERNFEGIKNYLEQNKIEGLVFHRENGEVCKIKRTDFGFDW